MFQVVRHWTILLIGMTMTGLICAAALPFIHSARGGVIPSIFLAESPVAATFVTMIAMALALGLALSVGRLTNTAVGLFVMGWGMTVFAMRTDTVQEIALAGEPNFILIALETLFWAVVVLMMTLLMFVVTGGFRDVHPKPYEKAPDPIRSTDALRCAAAGFVVLPGVLLIAQSPMKGQVLTAVFMGAMGAGLLGRLVSPHVQPILVFASPVVFGAIGHLIAMVQLARSGMTMSEAFVNHAFPTLSLPMPVDYAGASMMGVAFGLGWARSFLHHEEEEERESKGEAGKQPAGA